MLEIISNMPENVMAVSAKGKVTGDDYTTVLIPAIEERLKTHGRLRLLYHLGCDFSGFTLEAMWDDAKIGIQHLTAFEKIAVVSDTQWITGAARLFAFLIPCPVKVFGNDQLAEAKAWVTE